MGVRGLVSALRPVHRAALKRGEMAVPPFVAGATDAGILNGRIRNSYDESSVLNFPLEFKDFFFYAKDIGKVEAVAEMFDQYKNAAEKLK